MIPGAGIDRQAVAGQRGRPSDRHQIRRAEETAEDQHFTDHHPCPLYGQPNQDGITNLPPGKRRVMEKFFKPVHSPSAQDEIKPRKHQHHHHHHDHQQHPHHHHHLHHHQETESHSYTKLDDSDRNTDESHGHHQHHHQRGPHLHGNPHHDHHHPQHHQHQPQQLHHGEEDEILYNHHTSVTLSRASSSSLSSSSSSTSSSSSWYTEVSANDPFSIRHAERPQHSLSCSNILDVRGGFREDDGSEPVVFATVKHGNHGGVYGQVNGRSQQKGTHGFSPLHRGHSRSEEGLLQTSDSELGGGQRRAPKMDYGPLYKTASLNRSLAFSDEDILLGVSGGPKRAVSSSQLPGKGILKNRKPHADIRKAKSMEVLSPRVAKGQGQSGEKGKGITQAEMERARENFVQGKLQFSAFLDEITKQVISPSHLSILGVNSLKTPEKISAPAQAPGPAKPQLPPKKHKESSGEEREQHPKASGTQEKPARSNPQSRKHSDHSNPDKLISYVARNHHGSPPPHHYPHPTGQHSHRGGSRKDRSPPPTEGPAARDRYGRCGAHLTDGTSTSPEPLQPKHRPHRKQRPATTRSPPPHPQHQHPGPGHRRPANSPPSPAQASGPGHGSESPSSKSDSSRTRDTASTATSQSSEQSGRHHSRAAHMGHPKQHRDTPCDADQLQALQEENSDLHQNLLQTVVCIESLEAELQRTREELGRVKEKYKSLLETHTGTRQANNLLGEHLHIASESLSSERKFLISRMAHLSSELEDAHRTIAALENINVPCLIKQLLEKHFDSTETIQSFLKTATPFSPSATTSLQADNQSQAPRAEEASHDWLKELEACPPRVTAFMPWKQGAPTAGGEAQHESSPSPPFSVADISTAIYKKMAAGYAATQHPFLDAPPSLQQARSAGDGRGGAGGVTAADLERGGGDVTSLSAQRILDDLIHQLHPHKEAGGGKEQQGRQEWAGGAGEQTGRVAE